MKIVSLSLSIAKMLVILIAITTVNVVAFNIDSSGTTANDIYEYLGPLSGIYAGGNNRFFEVSDSVRVHFDGDFDLDGKMFNGSVEIEAFLTRTTFVGKIDEGVMQGDAEISKVQSTSSAEFYSGVFNGRDFDYCNYVNSGTGVIYYGNMVDGFFEDDSAIYTGPLHQIFDGDLSFWGAEGPILDFSPIHFDGNDTAYYKGGIHCGRVSGVGSLFIIHDGDTLTYHGEFLEGKFNGIGTLKYGNYYSCEGHFTKGFFAGMGEITSRYFNRVFDQCPYIPAGDGMLRVKGLWAGITGLSDFFRVGVDSGETLTLQFANGEIRELSLAQELTRRIGGSNFGFWLTSNKELYDNLLTGAAIIDGGACIGSIVFPATASVTGPICGIGFFAVAGLSIVGEAVLMFNAIETNCYSDECVDDAWVNYAKKEIPEVIMLGLPYALGRFGKVAIASERALKSETVIKELDGLSKIRLPKWKEIDIVNDRLAFKQSVLEETGKSFRDGFVEYFVRLKNSGREDLIKDLWSNHKNFIKNSGIRAGGQHEWLEADKFVDYLVNPKWGKDGVLLAYTLPKLTQKTSEVIFRNGGAHTIYDATKNRMVPGPQSGRFHNELSNEITSCGNASCVFSMVNAFAKRTLTKDSYKAYVDIEQVVLQ